MLYKKNTEKTASDAGEGRIERTLLRDKTFNGVRGRIKKNERNFLR